MTDPRPQSSPDAGPEPPATGPRIVVGVDGSPGGTLALEWAARQAALTGATLEIHSSYRPGYVFVSDEEIREEMERVVAEAKSRIGEIAPSVKVETTTGVAVPAKALIDASRGADLLVVGSRGLGGFTGLLLGSVGKQCALHSHCPVVVVRPSLSGGAGTPHRQRIVVGVDGSAPSLRALNWSVAQAARTGATIAAVATWEWPAFGALGATYPSEVNPAGDMGKALEESLSPAREAHPEVAVDAVVIEGHPASVLVRESRSADLLVVGSRGRGQFTGMVLGSVSEHCVSYAECPVVVVRSEAK